MNNLNIAGRLGADAENKFTPNGKAVTEFSVAVSKGFGDNKTTTWFRCAWWGYEKNGTMQHQGLSPYLKKGAAVCVNGEINCHAYAGKDGPAASLDLRVSNVTLLQSGDEGQPSKDHAIPQQSPADDQDDDIPF